MTDLSLKWHDFERPIRLTLLVDEAPLLCAAIKRCLPLRSVSWHSVISGENIGFPLPVVWTEFDNPRPRTSGDAFLYANGQLGIIPYGKTTEPGDVNVFGRVHQNDLENLSRVGHAVAENFRAGPGHPYFVDIRLAE